MAMADERRENPEPGQGESCGKLMKKRNRPGIAYMFMYGLVFIIAAKGTITFIGLLGNTDPGTFFQDKSRCLLFLWPLLIIWSIMNMAALFRKGISRKS